MSQLIDGKKISKQIKDELKEEMQRLSAEGKHACMAVVQVGNDPASSVYVKRHVPISVSGQKPMNFRKRQQKKSWYRWWKS